MHRKGEGHERIQPVQRVTASTGFAAAEQSLWAHYVVIGFTAALRFAFSRRFTIALHAVVDLCVVAVIINTAV